MNYDELSSLCCDSDMEERLEDYFDEIGAIGAIGVIGARVL